MDRRRHLYVLGKTGMGKTTLIENLIASDLAGGRGFALIDPHGDLAETVVGNLPKRRINDTIVFDPADAAWPVGFNLLDCVAPERRSLVASGVVGVFKKVFAESWGPRLEHTLRSTLLALLEVPGATLLSVPLMLTNDAFRETVTRRITDPVIKAFWSGEFARLNASQRTETVGPILNKVGQFLSSPLLRNVLGQPRAAFSPRRAMDHGKIVIINLSKGRLGEDASALLGALLVTSFQLDAMSRADMPEDARREFTLYVDEFQDFATESFATILSEARKYRLSLVLANQYVAQMPEAMRAAIFGNVGSLAAFQVGASDAALIKDALQGDVLESDLLNARRHTAYLRLSIDGMTTRAFSADMLPPAPRNKDAMAHRYAKVLAVSREKYATPRSVVTEKIAATLRDSRHQDGVRVKREKR
jgi:type IV secretory pathway TraG/TraD family ATPase VirD4